MEELKYIAGTNGDDVIRGRLGADYINRFEGNDLIYGAGGSDIIWGGDGNDSIGTFAIYPAMTTSCVVHGEDGNDNISADNIGDTVYADAGNDHIYGKLDQTIHWGDGDDIFYVDEISFRHTTPTSAFDGGRGYDVLTAGYGPELLVTPDFSNSPLTGFEELRTDGNLILTAAQLAGFDRIGSIDMGVRIDDVELSTSGTVDLSGKLAADLVLVGSAGADTVRLADTDLASLEFWGGWSADEASADNVRGGGGSDSLHGLGGNDFLDGGAGVDRLYGYEGLDTLSGGAGNDYLYGRCVIASLPLLCRVHDDDPIS